MGDDASAGAARIATSAPAKLNLFLHVPGRRADGYHRVDSLIAFAGIGDFVTVEAADKLTLAIDGPFAGDLPVAADNLVLRAAELLRARAGLPRAGAAIRLTKNLPVASGIGGGSADAAAALRALAALWQPDLAADDVHALARTLGADVPVCLASRIALVTGIGDETIAAPDLPEVALLLVNPGIAQPTADIFRALAAPPLAADAVALSPDGWGDIADAATLAERLAGMRNDLEEPAQGLAPQITRVLDALRALPGCLLSRMSGSGATCYGLFADAAAAQAGAEILQAAHPDWWRAATALRRAPPALDQA